MACIRRPPRSRLVPLPATAEKFAQALTEPAVFGAGSLMDALLKLVRDATSLDIVRNDIKFDAIAALIREWQPQQLVVGLPLHPDGAAHDNTAHAQRFARQLEGRFGLPVTLVDERYTSVAAEDDGADDVDSAAAQLIVEQYLQQR